MNTWELHEASLLSAAGEDKFVTCKSPQGGSDFLYKCINIYTHTGSGGALCFFLSDSPGVMVMSIRNGLEGHVWAWVPTIQVALSASSPGTEASGVGWIWQRCEQMLRR